MIQYIYDGLENKIQPKTKHFIYEAIYDGVIWDREFYDLIEHCKTEEEKYEKAFNHWFKIIDDFLFGQYKYQHIEHSVING